MNSEGKAAPTVTRDMELLNAEIDRDEARHALHDARHEIERLRARLAELQKPQGHREERVAEWLRERGYAVTRVEQ